nr:MAG TPA: hypothetical protein [Caudoviricetes sp.]
MVYFKWFDFCFLILMQRYRLHPKLANFSLGFILILGLISKIRFCIDIYL